MKSLKDFLLFKFVLILCAQMFVINSSYTQGMCLFDAGPSKVIFNGLSTTIGNDGGLPPSSFNDYTFKWTNNNNSLVETSFPLDVSPTQTTTYFLEVRDDNNALVELDDLVATVAVVDVNNNFWGVGFKNDHKITKWVDHQVIDADDNAAVYAPPSTQGGTPFIDLPVCYTNGIKPKAFLILNLNNAFGPDIETNSTNSWTPPIMMQFLLDKIDIRVSRKVGNDFQEIANHSGISFPNGGESLGNEFFINTNTILFSQSWTDDLAKTEEVFKWEIKTKDSDTFLELGESETVFYWTKNTPIYPTFSTASFRRFYHNVSEPSLYLDPGIDFPPLYDLALEKATEYYLPNGTNDPDVGNVPVKLMLGLEEEQTYNSGVGVDVQLHPLTYFLMGGTPCQGNSMLLLGLLKSVGVDGEMLYTWGGSSLENRVLFRKTPASAQIWASISFNRPIHYEDSPALPHFQFHAIVKSSNLYLDPSYGEKGPEGGTLISAYELGTWNGVTVPQQYKATFPPSDSYNNYYKFGSFVCPHD